MNKYVIQTDSSKGRSFSAHLAGAVVANTLYPESRVGDNIRPIWAMWAGSETSLKPFLANLRIGKKAIEGGGRSGHKVEFLKSSKFHVCWQREPEGTLVTMYHPELFCLDPGMVDPEGIRFVLLPTKDLSTTTYEIGPALDWASKLYPHIEVSLLEDLAKMSYLFAAYLDRRTYMPLIADSRFYMQLLCASLEQNAASLPFDSISRFYSFGENPWHHSNLEFGAVGLSEIGITTPICFCASHKAFEEFLVEQTKLFRLNCKPS